MSDPAKAVGDVLIELVHVSPGQELLVSLRGLMVRLWVTDDGKRCIEYDEDAGRRELHRERKESVT